LKLLEREELLTGEILDIFHSLRKNGNRAVHESYESVEDAKTLLSLAYKVAVWFMQLYGEWDFDPPKFQLPDENTNEIDNINKLKSVYEKELNKVKGELAAIREQQEEIVDLTTRKKNSKIFPFICKSSFCLSCAKIKLEEWLVKTARKENNNDKNY